MTFKSLVLNIKMISPLFIESMLLIDINIKMTLFLLSCSCFISFMGSFIRSRLQVLYCTLSFLLSYFHKKISLDSQHNTIFISYPKIYV